MQRKYIAQYIGVLSSDSCLSITPVFCSETSEPTRSNLASHADFIRLVTFRVSRSRGEIYIGHSRMYVCLSLAAFPHYSSDPDVTWGMVGGAL